MSPHRAFFYYRRHELEAVRSGRWKLFQDSGALYDLDADVGEKWDVADMHPEIVSQLKRYLTDARS